MATTRGDGYVYLTCSSEREEPLAFSGITVPINAISEIAFIGRDMPLKAWGSGNY